MFSFPELPSDIIKIIMIAWLQEFGPNVTAVFTDSMWTHSKQVNKKKLFK